MSLDEVLGTLDFDKIETILVAFHSYTQNRASRAHLKSPQNWTRALSFVDGISQQLSSSIRDQNRFEEIHRKLIRIRTLYGSLKPVRTRSPRLVRALPASVIEDLYSIVDPNSERNPFRTDHGKWRNYVLFLLYLHQGLRRAEALLLSANAVKEEYQSSENRFYRWINIQDSGLIDPRSQRPSPKTINSIRQVPIAKPLADITNFFSANWRGKQPHPFLFANNQRSPLSLRSINYIFDELSNALSKGARASLEKAMHSPKVTPHDLRHTCAVVRISHFLEAGDEMEIALQKLRSFFGWSFASEMPRHYAKAHFDSRLTTIWQDKEIQRLEGDEAAFVFLATEADGFHSTPYGHCLNSFTVEPCPKALECFAGCRHLAAGSSSSTSRKALSIVRRLSHVFSFEKLAMPGGAATTIDSRNTNESSFIISGSRLMSCDQKPWFPQACGRTCSSM